VAQREGLYALACRRVPEGLGNSRTPSTAEATVQLKGTLPLGPPERPHAARPLACSGSPSRPATEVLITDLYGSALVERSTLGAARTPVDVPGWRPGHGPGCLTGATRYRSRDRYMDW